jgi:hypothetical protein
MTYRKEFISKLLISCNERNICNLDNEFHDKEDCLKSILEMTEPYFTIRYDCCLRNFIVVFDIYNIENNQYMNDLDEIKFYLEIYRTYNISFRSGAIMLTGLNNNRQIKHLNILRYDQIQEEIEKYPDYDFRRIWPTNDIKIALKD